MTRWLRADVAMNVAYDDRTRAGSPVSQRPDESVRQAFAPLLQEIERSGFTARTAGDPRALGSCTTSAGFAALATPAAQGWTIVDEVLYPDPAAAPPRFLTLARPDHPEALVRVALPDEYWAPVHDLIAALCGPGLDSPPPSLSDDLRGWLAAIDENGLTTSEVPIVPQLPPIAFLGHNSLALTSPRVRVLVDPFLPEGSERYGSYQPIQMAQLGHVDALVVTHSHPDHFLAASLLRVPRTTRVIVPRMDRETILSVDMARRARELGFLDVVEVVPGDEVIVGDVTIRALPFHGEQPTTADRLHPSVRNEGCTFVLSSAAWSIAVCADAGVDGEGSMVEVARRHRRAHGPVDVVFSGYRGWITYPAQLLVSSVARYALFVPPDLWGERQQLMSDANDAVDVAEAFGAHTLVPYADGGAPWHWELGLGPRLDGEGQEMPGFDPFPERVSEAAAARAHSPDGTWMASPARVVILRPGDGFDAVDGSADPVSVDGHRWPWAR